MEELAENLLWFGQCKTRLKASRWWYFPYNLCNQVTISSSQLVEKQFVQRPPGVVQEEADDSLRFCSLQSKRRSSKERTRSWRWTPWSCNRGGSQSPEVRNADFTGLSLVTKNSEKACPAKMHIALYHSSTNSIVLLTALKTNELLQMILYTVEAGLRR
jgi:hypothetical protein